VANVQAVSVSELYCLCATLCVSPLPYYQQ
jgi:hypothetical protein